MKEPNFIYDNKYYFDVDTKTIYGRKKDSFSYRHELSHYKDHCNKSYRRINHLIQLVNQTAALFFSTALIVSLLTAGNTFHLIYCIGYAFIPYCLWSFQEEVRADIYAWRNRK